MNIKVVCMLATVLVAGLAGWVARGNHEDSKKLSSLNSAIVAGWQLQSDLNGALAKLAKARADQLAKDKRVDRDYANYLKDPKRNTDCTKFSDSRVQLKNAASAAANSVSRP